jgi:hypothetical protein
MLGCGDPTTSPPRSPRGPSHFPTHSIPGSPDAPGPRSRCGHGPVGHGEHAEHGGAQIEHPRRPDERAVRRTRHLLHRPGTLGARPADHRGCRLAPRWIPDQRRQQRRAGSQPSDLRADADRQGRRLHGGHQPARASLGNSNCTYGGDAASKKFPHADNVVYGTTSSSVGRTVNAATTGRCAASTAVDEAMSGRTTSGTTARRSYPQTE